MRRPARTFLGAIVALLACGLASVEGDDGRQLPRPLPDVPQPKANPATPEKIALGRKLFFDQRLSRTKTVACATCHDPEKGFADGRKLAVGVNDRRGSRHTPSLVNVGYAKSLMWDGRADSLEEQALLPIQNPREMDLSLEELERRLRARADYVKRFRDVFEAEPTAERAAKAIAAYERTLVVRNTPFDKYLRGDEDALDPAAIRGMKLFFGQARCHACHSGPNLADGKFHNVGVIDPEAPDEGRAGVTGRDRHRAAFRTPQLRQIARTAPYMHDGRFDTLKEVVRHYNFGGVTDAENPHRDDLLQVLYLDDQQSADLLHFLEHALTTPPPKPRRQYHP